MLTWISFLGVSYLVISTLALGVNNRLKSKGFKGIPNKDCFNPLKWFSVFIGYILKWVIPLHVFEQFVLRLYDPECRPDCILRGPCKECACDALAKAYSPLEKCSKGNYPKIIWSKSKYEKFREEFPVRIEVKYGKIINL